MRQTDENFVSMCRAVQDVLTKHATVWETNVAFKNQALNFNELIDGVNAAMESAEVVSTGATADKGTAEMNAVLLAVNLAKRASIYAMEVGNMELHDQLRVTKSTMLRRPDTMTLAKLRDIYTRLNAIVAELADYGVSATELSSLNAMTDTFDTLIARPRDLIVERKGYNQDTIPNLLASIREVLYKMDSLVNIFSETDFVKEYKDARIIIDLGKRGSGDVPEVS